MIAGKREPYGAPVAGSIDAGPVVPWQPPSTFGHTTKNRSVSIGAARADRSRPTSRLDGGPGPAGPAAWLSPVSACSTSTAFDASASSVPHVSYATVTCSSRAAGFEHVRRVVEQRRELPTARIGSPGRHAPVTRDRVGIATIVRGARSRPLGGAEAGVEVGEDVVERLDADRQAHEVRASRPSSTCSSGVELLVRGATRGGSRGCARRRRWRGG